MCSQYNNLPSDGTFLVDGPADGGLSPASDRPLDRPLAGAGWLTSFGVRAGGRESDRPRLDFVGAGIGDNDG